MSENNAAFDKDEQAILSQIVPDETATEAETSLPVETVATPEPEPEATTPAATPAPTPEPEPAETAAAPQGDTRAALRASRRAEKRMRDELEQLRQENEALKQGKAPANTSVSDAELAELEVDFPIQAKAVRRMRELEQELAQARAPAQREFEAPSYDPEIQEVIDGVPTLVAWQYDPAAQDKFARAIEYDKALAVDPDWRDRKVAERFAEAARRTQAALSPAPSVAPVAAPRTDPAAAIAAAPVSGPKGISDFRGGAPANAPSVNFAGMTDEQIMASLPVS